MGFTPTQNITAEKFTPTVNLTVSTLPSKSISYPPNAVISYRPYTFGEVKRLSQSKLTNKDSFNELLSGVTTSFDKLDLTVSDALFIGLLRKISTLGTTEFTAPYVCSCGAHNVAGPFKTDSLEFDDIKATELPVCVTLAGKDYEFNPLTVRQYFNLLDSDKESEAIAALAIQSGNINNYESLFNLPVSEASVLEEVEEYLYHGVKGINHNCVRCKKSNIIDLDGGGTFVLPFRSDEESTRPAIHFGKRAKNKSH